ncbi:CorA family divalent cation transporter [Botrimarina hoheduenensis]|uniref:CorA-like Mg2+ transporter protein n=1 Tax=Botrimarina hoheduenensis TaxID=2528000 RepID=A0A5C5WBT6_9BACT|nr:CorA family divalent cation transporter [Botrimarina hoheduenensis]TWT47521.1 CorA-like Mg2+ transporter protein [Botrimarina hoheduenensis]
MNDKPATPVAAEPLLPKAWTVPQSFRDRLGNDIGRQRLMKADGHLLLLLHSPPRPDEDARAGRIYWRSPEGLWKPNSLKHSEPPVGDLIGEYEALANQIDRQQDDTDTAREGLALLSALNPLVRAAHHLHGVLQAAREAAPNDRQLILIRDRAYTLTRRLELLQQDAKNTLDYIIARRAEQQAASSDRQAKSAHRLNVLAAFFFPLATLTAVFGMELKHGLEEYDAASAPVPMLIILGVGLLLGVIFAGFITRK